MFAKSVGAIDARNSHFNQVQGNQYIIFGTSDAPLNNLDKESVPDAQYNAITRDTTPCLLGTRKDILGRLTHWSSTNQAPPICWLYGEAGYGKSSIAQSVAQFCAARPADTPYRLAASFFFNREHPRRCSTRYVIPTLMCQLIVAVPALATILHTVLARNGSILNAVFEDQLQKLVVEVLRALPAPESPGIVLVDALDECQDATVMKRLIHFLADSASHPNLPLRVFITSRPEPAIRHIFSDFGPSILVFNLRDFAADDDILAFLEQELQDVRRRRVDVMVDMPSRWPSSDNLAALADKASGMFIYASTAAKFISDPRSIPHEQLTLILRMVDEHGMNNWGHADLDRLYKHVLSRVPDQSASLQVISAIMLLQTQFTSRQLAHFLGLGLDRVQLALEGLHSILSIPRDPDGAPVVTLHTSLHDFITNKDRSGEYFVDPTCAHARLTRSCLMAISKSLPPFPYPSFNSPLPCLLAVAEFTQQPNDVSIVAARYACRQWTYHLAQSSISGNDYLRSDLWSFCRRSVVPWRIFLVLDEQPINMVWPERGFQETLFPLMQVLSPLLILTRVLFTTVLRRTMAKTAVAGLVATMIIEQCMVEHLPGWLIWPLTLALVGHVAVNGRFTYPWALIHVGLLGMRVRRRVRNWCLAFGLAFLGAVLQALLLPSFSQNLRLVPKPFLLVLALEVHLKPPRSMWPMGRIQQYVYLAFVVVTLLPVVQELGILRNVPVMALSFVLGVLLLAIRILSRKPLLDERFIAFNFNRMKRSGMGPMWTLLMAGLYTFIFAFSIAGPIPGFAAGTVAVVVAGLHAHCISELMTPLGTLPRALQARLKKLASPNSDEWSHVHENQYECAFGRVVAGFLVGLLAGFVAVVMEFFLGGAVDLRPLLGPLVIAAYLEDQWAFRIGRSAHTKKMGLLSHWIFVQALQYVAWLDIGIEAEYH